MDCFNADICSGRSKKVLFVVFENSEGKLFRLKIGPDFGIIRISDRDAPSTDKSYDFRVMRVAYSRLAYLHSTYRANSSQIF